VLGAIIGDIVGPRFEWNNIKTNYFDFFTFLNKCLTSIIVVFENAFSQKNANKK
jgi:ADP-ribosylglycohydrolase